MATKGTRKRKDSLRQTTIDADLLPPRKTAKKGEVFIDSHCTEYGLTIGSRNSTTKMVETVVCRFCAVFGREEVQTVVDGAKKPRKRTTKCHFFSSFRTDAYRKHHESQHTLKWVEYNTAITVDDRENFWKRPAVPYTETIRAAFECEQALKFQVRASIVEEIVEKLLLREDEHGTSLHARARAIFTPIPTPYQEQDSTTQGLVPDVSYYEVTESNPSRFRLCVRYLGRGASFRMAAALMDDTKEETGTGRFQGCTDTVAARYTRVVCAASLESLAQMMEASWGFSVALDCGTHQGKLYVDVRARFPTVGTLHNYHLLAIPLHERHTANNIYEVVELLLNALVPEWRDQLIGVSTDGAANMVGHITGLATQIEKASNNPITRVWCGLHQLDLKMQIIFEQALNSTYLSKLHGIIGHLRRQFNLISEVDSKCPKVASTRWLSMYSVANWLCTHVLKVRQHLVEAKAACDPNAVWWVFLFALREIAKEANAVFVSLQGLSTMVNQQRSRFVGLVQEIRDMTQARGPLSDTEQRTFDDATHAKCGAFVISYANAKVWLENLDFFVCGQLKVLDEDQEKQVVEAVARLAVLACQSINSLLHDDFETLPVTPRELVKTSMPTFYSIVERYRAQLERRLRKGAHNIVGSDFKKLKEHYRTDEEFRKAVDNFDDPLASFDAVWAIGQAATRFPTLALFCGGLASVFPNTATVESDFSLIVCEKDDQRASLTDISLESVLHCKQWQRLRQALHIA